ncbi:MAG TPA: DNA alkylation repair protein [Bacteroidia bacterium]|nr:DNA alkylation repair protein [Bacteroidia bacterium]
MTYTQIVSELKKLGDKEKKEFKEKKFGIVANNSLGIFQKDINELVRKIKKNNQLAIQLFDSGIYEARILCSKIYKPKDLTEDLMEKWVRTFENWEICDSFSMLLFAKSKFAVSKAIEWAGRANEFEKRAAFAIIAAYCLADKKATNESYENFFPLIIKHSSDERVYVKKAVNWALRSIGKRNKDLNKKAIEVAKQILALNTKTAVWIAKDALKELQSERVKILDYPREIYRSK